MTKIHFDRGVEVIVAPFIINNNNQVLLFKSPKWKEWAVCGGHIEPGETMECAVKRETKEEIGVDIDVIEMINVGDMVVSPPEFKRNAHFVYIDFLAKLKNDKFSFNEEITEHKWFDINYAIKNITTTKSCKEGLIKTQNWLKTNKL